MSIILPHNAALTNLQVTKQCPDTACTSALERVLYWPSTGECFCEANDFMTRAWNTVNDKATAHGKPIIPAEHFGPVKEKFDDFTSYLKEAKAALDNPDPKLGISQLRDLNERTINERQAPTEVASAPISVDTAVPTFIPPPKTDITPQLIDQSLAIQEQNTATISSVVIHIPDGKITFYFQLNGIIADTLAVNASTSLLCGAIGLDSEPDISVVPKYVQQGQGAPQTIVADCLCVAVNMYNPNVINFFILNEQGKTFSLTGSNKILDIDKLDTSQPLALSLMPILPGTQKRDALNTANVVPLRSRQILGVPCGQSCPYGTIALAQSSDGDCFCVFNDNNKTNVLERGVSPPDMYTATMSKEACEGIICHDNGGKPAMFNPFSLTCWCVDATYVEDNPSGWIPSS